MKEYNEQCKKFIKSKTVSSIWINTLTGYEYSINHCNKKIIEIEEKINLYT